MQATRKGNNALPQINSDEIPACNTGQNKQWTEPMFDPITPTYEQQQARNTLTPRARAIRTTLLVTALLVFVPIALPIITKLAGTIQTMILSIPLPALLFIIAGILFGNKKE